MRRGERLLPALAILAAAVALWFGLSMHRGLLLSEGIKSQVWPWAPAFPPGDVTAPALSDPVWQFVPWLELARRELQAGRLPLWNPHQSGGVPLLGNGISALGSPLVWPILAAGVPGAWNLSLLLRLLVALCGGFAWLRDLGRSRSAAALGAVGFALSGAFVAWLEHPQTLTIAALPLVFLFVRRLARRPTAAALAGLVAATYGVMSGGHPETQLMAAALAAAVLAEAAPSRREAALPVGGACLGAALAAPLLLPFTEYFLHSQARLGVDRRPFVLPLSDLARFLVPHRAGSNVIEGACTVSVTLLLLALAGVSSLRRDRLARFWAAVGVVVLLVAYDNPLSRALARGTPIYWTRALLLLPLPLAVLASGALDRLRERMRAAGWGSAARAAGPLAVALAFAELLRAAQGVHGLSRPADLERTTPLLEALRADRSVFRILPLHTFLSPNSATVYGLDDVRGYDALEPEPWKAPLESMGRVERAPTQLGVIEPWGLVPGGEALDDWNVKYLLLHPQFAFGAEELAAKKGLDLEQIYGGPDGRILRNRRVRPRVRLSGDGEVEVRLASPRSWTLRVRAPGPSTLTLANPMFPGWRARVDGSPARIASSSGQPIRVEVAAGEHLVEIDYAPLTFRLGCVLAAVSALATVLLARRLAARRVPAEPPASA